MDGKTVRGSAGNLGDILYFTVIGASQRMVPEPQHLFATWPQDAGFIHEESSPFPPTVTKQTDDCSETTWTIPQLSCLGWTEARIIYVTASN